MKHTLTYWHDEAHGANKVKIDYRPVHMYTLDDKEVQVVAPMKRTY